MGWVIIGNKLYGEVREDESMELTRMHCDKCQKIKPIYDLYWQALTANQGQFECEDCHATL